MQLDHLNLYVSDLARSRAFYEALLPNEGWVLNREFEDVAVGFGGEKYAIVALVRCDGEVQKTHVAFRFPAREDVDRLYQSALRAGATCNGEPGLRSHYHATYYAAFVLDPDGHNVEFVCHEST